MKQMPFKIEEGAIEQAKYRAKMAVRAAAHPIEPTSHKVQWRWATAVAVAMVVIVGMIGFVKYYDELVNPLSPMEQLIAEMQCASDEVVNELAVDVCYYLDEESSL